MCSSIKDDFDLGGWCPLGPRKRFHFGLLAAFGIMAEFHPSDRLFFCRMLYCRAKEARKEYPQKTTDKADWLRSGSWLALSCSSHWCWWVVLEFQSTAAWWCLVCTWSALMKRHTLSSLHSSRTMDGDYPLVHFSLGSPKMTTPRMWRLTWICWKQRDCFVRQSIPTMNFRLLNLEVCDCALLWNSIDAAVGCFRRYLNMSCYSCFGCLHFAASASTVSTVSITSEVYIAYGVGLCFAGATWPAYQESDLYTHFGETIWRCQKSIKIGLQKCQIRSCSSWIVSKSLSTAMAKNALCSLDIISVSTEAWQRRNLV